MGNSSAVLETPVIAADRAAEMFRQPIMASLRWATYEFALIGLSPIMLDRMTQEQVLGLITGQKVDYPKDEPLEDKARRKMYAATYEKDMPVSGFGFPRENLEAALRDAGTAVQYGSGKNDRVTMSTKGTELFNMIRLHEPFFELLGLDGKPADWVIDMRKGNATQGTGAVGIIRARFNEWGVVGHVDLNVDSKLSEDKMKELFTVAGIKQGLCSARPSKKMSFGQFALTHLKWISGADPKKSVTRSNGNGTRGRRKAAGPEAGDGEGKVQPANRLTALEENPGDDGNGDGNGEGKGDGEE